MFCAFSGFVEKPAEALHHKIDYLERLQGGIEDKVRQGLSRQEVRRKLLGPGDRFRLITGGQISKQNLINAFLKPSGYPRSLN
jgi:hypothetical protein